MGYTIRIQCTGCHRDNHSSLGSLKSTYPDSHELFVCRACKNIYIGEVKKFYRYNTFWPHLNLINWYKHQKFINTLTVEESYKYADVDPLIFSPNWFRLSKPKCPCCNHSWRSKYIATERGLDIPADDLQLACDACKNGMLHVVGEYVFTD